MEHVDASGETMSICVPAYKGRTDLVHGEQGRPTTERLWQFEFFEARDSPCRSAH